MTRRIRDAAEGSWINNAGRRDDDEERREDEDRRNTWPASVDGSATGLMKRFLSVRQNLIIKSPGPGSRPPSARY